MRLTSTTCRNCGGILLDASLSEYNEDETLDVNDRPSWLEFDGTKHFIRCPQCAATNILSISEDSSGTPVLSITRAIMEDE